MSRTILLIASLLLFSGQLVIAQTTTGTIFGDVKDASGAVIPRAAVTLKNLDTGITREIITDEQGRYHAPNLALGNYEVQAQSAGFRTELRSGIKLTVGREAVVNLVLNPGEVTERITVTGEAPLVESTTSAMGGLVDDRTIRDLPLNGRSYDQLAKLETGVVAYGGGSQTGRFLYNSGNSKFSVAGSRGNSNSFLLDGTDINDQANATPGGSAGTNLGVEAIREFKILTNNFTAEYGRSFGGIITAVTKSGTNQLHGTAFEFLRNGVLDARNFFDQADTPPFKRNQFGGVVGGAIKKDHTFFLAAFEGLREGLNLTKIAFVPTVDAKRGIFPTGTVTVNPASRPFLTLWPNPNGRIFEGNEIAEYISSPPTVTREDYVMGRIDHQVNDKHSLFGRYIFDNDSLNDPTENPNFVATQAARRQYSTLQLSSVLSPTVLNSFRFAYNRTFQAIDSQPTVTLGPEFSFIPSLQIGTIQIGQRFATAGANPYSTLGTSNTTPRYIAYNLFEWDNDLSIIRGKHAFKMGGTFKRIRDNTTQNTSLRGLYTFATFRDVLLGTASSLEASLPGDEAYAAFRQNVAGFYGQDDVQVNSRLTLNLGLRWEFASNPKEANGHMSILMHPTDPQVTIVKEYFKTTKKNIEPRVGFAWKLNGSGRSVLRGGVGIFHDHILPFYFALNVSKLPPYFTAANVSNPLFPNGYTQLRGGVPRLIEMDPVNRTPTKNHYSLSFQQQLAGETVIEIGYVGSQSFHLGRFRELNTPIPQFVNGQKFYPAGAPRLNPRFDSVRSMAFDATSNYNGLLIKVKGTGRAHLQYQVSYTFSRVIDQISGTASGDTARDPSTSLDPDDRKRDSARASFDATHNVVGSFSLPLPFQFDGKPLELIAGGWKINGIVAITAGQPFTARVGFNQARDGNTLNADRPSLIPGGKTNPVLGTADRYFDPNQFLLPAPGTYGNLARNSIIGPGLVNIDATIEKDFKVRERADVLFRAEFFNLFNRPNFGLPTTAVFAASGARSGNAGRIVNTITTSRQIQFGLKLTF